ncbi:hypothetical protein BV20DRAFT_974504 [Pilatotrama ljubarskyi]|nr:hypothetical protein BV20DRAFT_974504 [Pilatotrama ljubarskyi]
MNPDEAPEQLHSVNTPHDGEDDADSLHEVAEQGVLGGPGGAQTHWLPAMGTHGGQPFGQGQDLLHAHHFAGHMLVHGVLPASAQGPNIPPHEWSSARYPATTRQMHTIQSMSIARSINLPFLDDPTQQIDRAGASRINHFLMRGEEPPAAVVNYILAEGVEPEPTEPFVWPDGDTEPRTTGRSNASTSSTHR